MNTSHADTDTMAFAAPQGLPVLGSAGAGAGTSSVCARTVTGAPARAASGVTMRCRRDLKKEKALRNLEFARSHRKKVSRFTNRRAVATEKSNADNEFLSSIFGTISFGQDVLDDKPPQRKGGGAKGKAKEDKEAKVEK